MNEEAKPVWLENWTLKQYGGVSFVVFDECGATIVEKHEITGSNCAKETAMLVAAAPALVRALLLAEPHVRDCGTDAEWDIVMVALYAVGLDTEAKRDAARVMMREEKIVVRAQTT